MKRYEDMTREERIEDSDRVAIMELERELRKEVKKRELVRATIEEWIKKPPIQAWLRKKFGRKSVE